MLIFEDSLLQTHDTGPTHPESPRRLEAISPVLKPFSKRVPPEILI